MNSLATRMTVSANIRGVLVGSLSILLIVRGEVGNQRSMQSMIFYLYGHMQVTSLSRLVVTEYVRFKRSLRHVILSTIIDSEMMPACFDSGLT